MQPRQALGWTSLMIFMLILSGIQLLMIGILGEYQARVFDEVKGRHGWVVAETMGLEQEKAAIPTASQRSYRPHKEVMSADSFS